MDFINIFSCLKCKEPQLSLSHCSISIAAEVSNVNCVKTQGYSLVYYEYNLGLVWFLFSVKFDLSGLRNAHSLMNCGLVSGATEHNFQVEIT